MPAATYMLRCQLPDRNTGWSYTSHRWENPRRNTVLLNAGLESGFDGYKVTKTVGGDYARGKLPDFLYIKLPHTSIEYP